MLATAPLQGQVEAREQGLLILRRAAADAQAHREARQPQLADTALGQLGQIDFQRRPAGADFQRSVPCLVACFDRTGEGELQSAQQIVAAQGHFAFEDQHGPFAFTRRF